MKKFVDVECPQCKTPIIDAFCEIPEYPECPTCHIPTTRLFLPSSVPTIHGDSIPGGIEIKHGLCHPDGSPKRYYSHSEIHKAAKAKHLVNQPERGVADRKVWDKLSRSTREAR